MSLRLQAEADLRAIVEDSTSGFGWPITVTAPDGTTAALTGLSTDISTLIDPETGQMVSGRQASVALALASLAAAGVADPRHVASGVGKPWTVTFADIGGAPHTFKVARADPDRAAGIIVLFLEAYRP